MDLLWIGDFIFLLWIIPMIVSCWLQVCFGLFYDHLGAVKAQVGGMKISLAPKLGPSVLYSS